MTRSARRAAFAGVAVAGIVALAAVAWLVLPRQPERAVAVPGDDAAPVEVVRAYLDALDAHDCDTARALSVPSFADSADIWCTDLRNLDVLDVGTARAEDPVSMGWAAGTDLVGVPTQIDVDWRWLHDDGSLDEGEHGWGYVLVQRDGAWRIVDHGTG